MPDDNKAKKMSLEELDKMLQDKVDAVAGTITKGYEERLGKLEAVAPSVTTVHTASTGVVDDGNLEEVGKDVYRLPGGSVINVKGIWKATGKGYMRGSHGVFQSLGDETKEFLMEANKSLKKRMPFLVETKALDISDVMRSTEDAGGGLFVPEDFRYAMLQFAPPGTIVWPRAQVWPMTGPNIKWPRLVQDLTEGEEEFFGNMIVTWTEEGGEKPETRPQFDILSLDAHEISAYTEITNVLIEDSAINLGNLLVQLFQGTYWYQTDREFLRGFGNTRPLGVLNDPNIGSVDRVTASRVRYEDLLNMSTALPPMFDAGACWMMSKACFNSLRKQKDENGQPVIQLGLGYNDFSEGVAGYVLGYPVVVSDYRTARLGYRGDCVLGDWKHYFIGERTGITVEMSRQAGEVFRQNRTAFRASGRLGGIPEQPKAFVVLDDTADANQS